MFEEIKNINLLAKILNVNSNEWGKVINTFMLRFLYRASFVIAWTLIVTLFVEFFGIKNLPFLFIINALFSILASLFYTGFLYKYSHFRLMLVFLFISGISIFFAAYLFNLDKRLFLFLLIFIESVFLVQFKIFLNAYIEKAYTPLESERIFPLTESSETFGAIIAGLLLFSFSSIFSISSFLYIWIIFLFLIIPFLIYFEGFVGSASSKSPSQTRAMPSEFFKFLKKEIFILNKSNFIKGLFTIVFLHWFIFNLVEFQYVSALYENIKNVVVDSGSGFEHAFIHDLGALFVLFNLSALFCQIILAGRLMNHLGIVGSMLLHPIITFISFIAYLFNNGFYPILFAKNNFMISSVVLNNSYHCSFYAIKEDLREFVRQFAEGIVRPLGALIGTFFLLFIQFFAGNSSVLYVNIGIIFVSLIFFRVIYKQQQDYFKSALFDLHNSEDLAERKNAIEVLAQKGSRGFLSVLISLLNNKNEKISIKIKVLDVLGQSGQIYVVKFILKQLNNEHRSIRSAALDSLNEFFQNFKLFNQKYLLFRMEIITELKKLFKSENNYFIRLKIIQLLTRLSGLSTLEFLMEILNGDNNKLKNEAIRSLSHYKNSNVEKILSNYLKSGKIDFQINAAIALGKLKVKQRSILAKIERFIYSNDKLKVLSGIYAIGELNLKSKKRFLLTKLYSTDLDLKRESALALSKMGYFESIPTIIELLLHDNIKIAKKIKFAIKTIDKNVHKQIQKLLKVIVFEKIDEFKKKYNYCDLNFIDKPSLFKLRLLYGLVEEYDEVENINKILKK